MDYKRFDEIKKELDDDKDVSLLMLQDLKKFIDIKISNWGAESGKTFRIM
jgi:uncharacterized protein YukE